MADKQEITVMVCGTKLCKDGKPHDDDSLVDFRDENGRVTWASVACSRCGLTVMDRCLLGDG
uniref:Uncharacterized protein n=1 Tax=viral metagenome TaxID=1070528 RepID=A0A6M3LCL4_9ZZZZ